MGREKVLQNNLIIFFIFFIMFYTIPNGVFGEDILFDPNLHQVVIKHSGQDYTLTLSRQGRGIRWYGTIKVYHPLESGF